MYIQLTQKDAKMPTVASVIYFPNTYHIHSVWYHDNS